MNRFWRILSLALIALFVLAGCGSDTSNNNNGTATGASRNLTFYVITHGQASDPFWSVVKKGVDQAATDMRVKVIYEAPPTFDMVAMSHLIDAAVAAHPDGLVVSIPDANALGTSIKAAVAAGIPVISINSGSDVAKSLGVLVHVGQTEEQAGLGGASAWRLPGRRTRYASTRKWATRPSNCAARASPRGCRRLVARSRRLGLI